MRRLKDHRHHGHGQHAGAVPRAAQTTRLRPRLELQLLCAASTHPPRPSPPSLAPVSAPPADPPAPVLPLATTLFLFCAYEFLYLLRYGTFCTPTRPHGAAGSCYNYLHHPHYATGLTLHLLFVLPAAMLAVLQFIPAIRVRYPALHRYIGYASLALCAPGMASGVPILDVTFGGDLSIRSAALTLFGVSAYALWRAWHAIARQGRVDEHRKWMLRAWSYLGSVVTMRPLIVAPAMLLHRRELFAPVHVPLPCAQVAWLLAQRPPFAGVGAEESLWRLHPSCRPEAVGGAGGGGGGWTVVEADFWGMLRGRGDLTTAATNGTFGMGMWMGLVVHAVLVEWYLARTTAEAERLRKASGKVRERLGLPREEEVNLKVKGM